MLAAQHTETLELYSTAARGRILRAFGNELRGSIALTVMCLLVVVTELWRR